MCAMAVIALGAPSLERSRRNLAPKALWLRSRAEAASRKSSRGAIAATCVQRIQKALTQMNIQLANVISDLSGVTGQMIVRAIIAGERDPWKLAQLSPPRI
jgi:hypothetical protein